MATLTIRSLPDEVHARLRVRAAKNGRSTEAEARAILTSACPDESGLSTLEDVQRWVDEMLGGNKPKNVVDEFIAERRREGAREEAEWQEHRKRHGGGA